MTRHFLGLYTLIVLTLAAGSWGQDKLLQLYGAPDSSDERAVSVALNSAESWLHSVPSGQWPQVVSDLAAKTRGHFELFSIRDIAGAPTLRELRSGMIAYMQADGESWALKQVDSNYVLALRSSLVDSHRGLLEWMITVLFYAAIALVVMLWIWPLRRDLRILEEAAAHFGNKNWGFEAPITSRSQIYGLAETFRKMAERIDGLVASHKDMSNAVSHEIKTPLSRMLFAIESAQHAQTVNEVKASLDGIKSDVVAINDLVSATLSYAILDRADMSLNLGVHNFTLLMPAIADAVRHDARPDIQIDTELQGDTDQIRCDMHLMETAMKNLLYNAVRYARQKVRVTFATRGGAHQLIIDDDGPGIPEKDRERVFNSFVRLEPATDKKGFGLGLAIVRRIIEWHGGAVIVESSPLGGARICASWPVVAPS